MGTNFYYKEKKNYCEHCKRFEDVEIHIGKRSNGWNFLFNNEFETHKEWCDFINKNKDNIFNEYGEKVSSEEMLEIFEWKGKRHYEDETDLYFEDGEYDFAIDLFC